MSLDPNIISDILQLIRIQYSNWKDFRDPKFTEDELDYKQMASEKARDLLSKAELERLLNEQAYTIIVERLETVARATNLLFQSVPTSGDLRLLYDDNIDKNDLCIEIYRLLYGKDSSSHRLQRFCDFLAKKDITPYWTFPTYYLFLCHPDSEIFVKPTKMRAFFDLAGRPEQWQREPSGEAYEIILQLANELKQAFAPYRAENMINVQSIMWVAVQTNQKTALSIEKRNRFGILFDEFANSYYVSDEGQTHIQQYDTIRVDAKNNYEAIVAAEASGQDITDAVLLKLLPHADSKPNRSRGAWISLAQTITGDVRKWFERAGWAKAEDWPAIAHAIWDFIRRCQQYPDELEAACDEFANNPLSKGFQSGMLSPILNALNPDAFYLINSKPVQVMTYLTEDRYGQQLQEYPQVNTVLHNLVDEVEPVMREILPVNARPADLFDMFCHWLVAIKRYEFREPRFWKIAPGENAWQWEECLEGRFIAIGWDDLGDLTDVSRKEFDSRREQLVTEHPGWTKIALEQVWKFAHHIQEGDKIVANRGTSEVLGMGTVVGTYYYVPGVRYGHRLPVEWEDTGRRKIEEGGWRRTLIELDRAKLEAIERSPIIYDDLSEPFSHLFRDMKEAETAFAFLDRVLQLLGVKETESKLVSITFPINHKGSVMRINYGPWVVVDIRGSSSYAGQGINLALRKDLVENSDFAGVFNAWPPYTPREGEEHFCVYELPWLTLIDMDEDLRVLFEQSLRQIGERFAHWSGTPYRQYHHQEVLEAIFYDKKRQQLLTRGINLYEYSVPQQPVAESHLAADAAFSPETFSLLAGLHANPTKAYYQEHKDGFVAQVEQPFQALMQQVAAQLPPAITSLMETEKRLYGRILKNDWGQGGAWDYYWGAFYPKESKRTEDAQLSLWINHNRLEFGFYIGNYGVESRGRFIRNCREFGHALRGILHESLLADFRYVFGGHENFDVADDGSLVVKQEADWGAFLADPAAFDFDVSIVLPRPEVMARSATALAEEIHQAYRQIFPLVLLACEDDPLPAIARYLDVEGNGSDSPEPHPPVTLSQIAEETGFEEDKLARWVRAIERKKQAILYGPPGTGKTFVAEYLAKHLAGGGDGVVEFVQFHPAYAYEDFMQGIRPKTDAGGRLKYTVEPGRFLNFIIQARQRKGMSILIIDEINRANLARVFGELMYLLEYREKDIPLAGGGRLRIPASVRILGTMNTADRSIALVDHALRRRFAFLALQPDFRVLRHYHRRHETGFELDGLIAVLTELNNVIADPHYEVGITFFLRSDLAIQIEDIWRMEIEPYLEEYFFDRPDKVSNFRWESIKDRVLLP